MTNISLLLSYCWLAILVSQVSALFDTGGVRQRNDALHQNRGVRRRGGTTWDERDPEQGDKNQGSEWEQYENGGGGGGHQKTKSCQKDDCTTHKHKTDTSETVTETLTFTETSVSTEVRTRFKTRTKTETETNVKVKVKTKFKTLLEIASCKLETISPITIIMTKTIFRHAKGGGGGGWDVWNDGANAAATVYRTKLQWITGFTSGGSYFVQSFATCPPPKIVIETAAPAGCVDQPAGVTLAPAGSSMGLSSVPSYTTSSFIDPDSLTSSLDPAVPTPGQPAITPPAEQPTQGATNLFGDFQQSSTRLPVGGDIALLSIQASGSDTTPAIQLVTARQLSDRFIPGEILTTASSLPPLADPSTQSSATEQITPAALPVNTGCTCSNGDKATETTSEESTLITDDPSGSSYTTNGDKDSENDDEDSKWSNVYDQSDDSNDQDDGDTDDEPGSDDEYQTNDGDDDQNDDGSVLTTSDPLGGTGAMGPCLTEITMTVTPPCPRTMTVTVTISAPSGAGSAGDSSLNSTNPGAGSDPGASTSAALGDGSTPSTVLAPSSTGSASDPSLNSTSLGGGSDEGSNSTLSGTGSAGDPKLNSTSIGAGSDAGVPTPAALGGGRTPSTVSAPFGTESSGDSSLNSTSLGGGSDAGVPTPAAQGDGSTPSTAPAPSGTESAGDSSLNSTSLGAGPDESVPTPAALGGGRILSTISFTQGTTTAAAPSIPGGGENYTSGAVTENVITDLASTSAYTTLTPLLDLTTTSSLTSPPTDLSIVPLLSTESSTTQSDTTTACFYTNDPSLRPGLGSIPRSIAVQLGQPIVAATVINGETSYVTMANGPGATLTTTITTGPALDTTSTTATIDDPATDPQDAPQARKKWRKSNKWRY